MKKIIYTPSTKQEKFGIKIFNLLVENFSKTYFVGGTVRDIFLGKKVYDVDIATQASPVEVVDTLKRYYIECNIGYERLGVIIAKEKDMHVAVATFRKDLPADSRYPEVLFAQSEKVDAKRRDFTINALYFQPNSGIVLDFYGGREDIKKKLIRFIGNPASRIKQDPLRVVRALRFALSLNFKLEEKTRRSIKNNFGLISSLTKSRVEKEIEKLKNNLEKKKLHEVLRDPEMLDKYF